jgi:2-haloacid dehalogenase
LIKQAKNNQEMKSTILSHNNITISRRDFINSTVSAITAVPHIVRHFEDPAKRQFKALAFDAFAIFDPHPVTTAVSQVLPEKWSEVTNQWRTSQFEYAWLRTAADKYQNFWQVTKDALVFAANKTQVMLSSTDTEKLMNQYLQLEIWPDVIPALEHLKSSGLRLCFLSNFTTEMLSANIKHCGIENYFDAAISTDQVNVYKPNHKAYELGTKTMRLKKEEILFVAFAGWDACGAKWFGYPTYWLNRLRSPEEQLHIKPDAQGSSFPELLNFIGLKK